KLRNIITEIEQSTHFIPFSPTTSLTPDIHHHECAKCKQPISCKATNNLHYLAADAILFNDKPYHKLCTETEPTSQQTSSSYNTQQDSSTSKDTFIQKLQQSLNEYRSNNLLSSGL
ncbi:19106_t:CDS:1, partial [Racocetra fulgida]